MICKRDRSRSLARSCSLEGQLESLCEEIAFVINKKGSIGPDNLCNFGIHDEGKPLCYDLFITFFPLVQSQAQSGPASPKATDEYAEAFLGILGSLLQLFNSVF